MVQKAPSEARGPGFTPRGCHLECQLPWARYSEPQDPNLNLLLLESFICFSLFWKSAHFLRRLSLPSLDASRITSDTCKPSTPVQRADNLGLQAKPRPPSLSGSKVLLERDHAPSFTYPLWLLSTKTAGLNNPHKTASYELGSFKYLLCAC